jgi:hypothetical protein
MIRYSWHTVKVSDFNAAFVAEINMILRMLLRAAAKINVSLNKA